MSRLKQMTFHTRILLAFVCLIVIALIGTSTVLYFAARRTGLGLAEQQLEVAERVVDKALKSRNEQMRAEVTTVAADFGFREAVTSHHRPTIVSALENHSARIHADMFALLDNDGSVSAIANGEWDTDASVALQEALHLARLHNSAPVILSYQGRLLQLVIVPVKAPDLVGWACMGMFLNEDFVRQIKETAGSDITLITDKSEESPFGVAASTLPNPVRAAIAQVAEPMASHVGVAFQQALNGEAFLTLAVAGDNGISTRFLVVAQMPVAATAAPLVALRRDMMLFGGVVTIVCLIAALLGARLLAEPVRALSNAARSLSMSKRRGSASTGDDELGHVARAFHALARRAHYDSLTGLPNRALLNERLKESMERMRKGKSPLAVVFIDLNGFKKINDTLGHEMGDLVLRKTAQRLGKSITSPNTVARLGGDEFVLVLECADQSTAIRTVEELARLVGKSMVSPSGPIKVGMSAGISLYPSQSVDQEELLQLADAAMYSSKTRKAGPVVAAPIEPTKTIPPTTELAANTESEALDDDSVSTDAWQGRDLVTQSTRAVSAILGPIAARIPNNEPDRLRALRQLKYLDKPPRESFDRITRLAARSLDVPIALVSLVDENRQWFLSRVGIEAAETPRDVSFCAHAVFERSTLVVPDATRDERFSGNPLVIDDPKIRAYAGAPIYTPDGHAIGTLCVVDLKPREFGDADVSALQDMAHIIDDIIRIRLFTLAYDQRKQKKTTRKLGNSRDFPLYE